MPNGTYGGVRGKETKVGQKTFVSRPTRFSVVLSGGAARVLKAEREGCKPNLLTPYIVVVYIPLRFNCSQIVAIGEYFENTHSYCCEICSLAFLGFKGTNK